ncbi:MAG: SIR2 family protein [Acidimicrobiia bacterium]|nr:SIR2 family protein [Acidimicrobiia bacterium]
MTSIPKHLVKEIHAGNCVAFVGAGFSAAGVPAWAELLSAIAASGFSDRTRQRVADLLAEPRTALDYEAAAQALRDEVGQDDFDLRVAARVGRPDTGEIMNRRLALLRGIPFRAILTTNFDGYLPGAIPGREAYLNVLRPQAHRWWDRRFWEGDIVGSQVVKLHGDASTKPPSEIVITRRDYRERLYRDPGYATFLRSVLATTTVLYLGFSFTDAYLNELRSEILALLDYNGGDVPVAYAVVNDVGDQEAAYLRKHEGVEVLAYDSAGGTDFSGFDDYLDGIYLSTSPKHLLGRLIARKRILWADSTASPHFGRELLNEASRMDGGVGIDIVRGPEEALDLLAVTRYDLVITRWGHQQATDAAGEPISLAEWLLSEIRRRDIRTPAIVFASHGHADENKRAVLSLGAVDYTFTWEGLFRTIEGVFRPGSVTG